MMICSAPNRLAAITPQRPIAPSPTANVLNDADRLVAPELACVVDTDAVRAKAVAREYAERYLELRNYVQNLLRFGFTEDDVASGGSDRIDAVVPQGSAEQIAEVVHAHLEAGADHVCVQPLGEDGIPRKGWTELAKALIA